MRDNFSLFVLCVFLIVVSATPVFSGTVDIVHHDPGDGSIVVTASGTFDDCSGSSNGTIYLSDRTVKPGQFTAGI